jgi:RimJ/RimL family protein N-acetyltransferase
MITKTNFDREFLQDMDLVYANSRSYAENVLSLDSSERWSHMWGYSESNRPLFAWGAVPYWPGVAEIWMAVDSRLQRRYGYMRPILNEIRDQMRILERDWGYHRLFGQYEVAQTQSAKLARILGFEREGILRKYGSGGEDYVICARVR